MNLVHEVVRAGSTPCPPMNIHTILPRQMKRMLLRQSPILGPNEGKLGLCLAGILILEQKQTRSKSKRDKDLRKVSWIGTLRHGQELMKSPIKRT